MPGSVSIYGVYIYRFAHQVTDNLLRQTALRRSLTGGQIRNVALHATLLSVELINPWAIACYGQCSTGSTP